MYEPRADERVGELLGQRALLSQEIPFEQRALRFHERFLKRAFESTLKREQRSPYRPFRRLDGTHFGIPHHGGYAFGAQIAWIVEKAPAFGLEGLGFFKDSAHGETLSVGNLFFFGQKDKQATARLLAVDASYLKRDVERCFSLL